MTGEQTCRPPCTTERLIRTHGATSSGVMWSGDAAERQRADVADSKSAWPLNVPPVPSETQTGPRPVRPPGS